MPIRGAPWSNGMLGAMVGKATQPQSEPLQKALLHMQAALQVLDDANAPADIGAHLDLALNRLQEHMLAVGGGWNPVPPPAQQGSEAA